MLLSLVLFLPAGAMLLLYEILTLLLPIWLDTRSSSLEKLLKSLFRALCTVIFCVVPILDGRCGDLGGAPLDTPFPNAIVDAAGEV